VSESTESICFIQVLNFNKFDVKRPEAIVESRCEGVILPETRYEMNSPWPHAKNLNCVFPCGSYELGDDIVLVYGGADAYVLAAKLDKYELLTQLHALRHHCQPHAEPLPRPVRSQITRRYARGWRQLRQSPTRFADELS
jgi:hypothetical protein